MTQVEILDRKHDTPQPYILDLLDKLAARQLLPVIEVTLVAVFVLVIAVDAHRKKTVRLAQSASPAPKMQIAERTASEPPPAAATETGARSAAPPRAGQGVAAGLNPILPPEIYHAGNPPSAPAAPAAASPATQDSMASPAAPDFQPRVPLPLDRPEGQAASAAPAPGNLAGSFAPIIPPGLYRPPAGAPPAKESGQAQAPTEAPVAPTAAKEAVTTAPTQEAARVADPASPPPPAATAGLASSLAPILPPGLYSASAGAPAAQEAARTAGAVPATPPAASSPPPAEPAAEAPRVTEPASPPSPTAAAGLASSLAPILPPGLYNASSGAPATPETPPAPTTPPPPAESAAVAAPASPPPSPASADLASSIAPIMPPAVYRAATDAPSPPQSAPPAAAKPETKAAPAPADTAAAVKSEAESEAAPGAAMTAPIVEARLHPQDAEKAALPDKQAEQKDFADAFQSASRMLERRLTPEERAASMAPDYVDAIQRIEGFYDPTRVGPFGGGLRMGIRPGTMSMTDVFGERWTRAYPDPNVHYRVGYHAETWLRPLSHKCEDFWRFRTDDSPVALDKLTPADCARIRAKTPSDTKLMADSKVVSAPLSVPAFAAPYPGNRMTHDELMAALRARVSAAREKLWLGRTPGLVRPVPAKPKPALSPDEDTQTN